MHFDRTIDSVLIAFVSVENRLISIRLERFPAADDRNHMGNYGHIRSPLCSKIRPAILVSAHDAQKNKEA
jgi:hypothetical protein